MPIALEKRTKTFQNIEALVLQYNDSPADDQLQRDWLNQIAYLDGDIYSQEEVDAVIERFENIDDEDETLLTPKQRYQVLEYIAVSDYSDVRSDIHPLLQIFGEQELQRMLDAAQQAYPNFNLMMGVLLDEDYDCLNISCHFEPRSPSSPFPDPEMDFPAEPFWDSADSYFFWSQHRQFENDFWFTLDTYPDEASFSTGERYPADYFEMEKGEDYENLVSVKDLLANPENYAS